MLSRVLFSIGIGLCVTPCFAQGERAAGACPDARRMQIVEKGLGLDELMRKHQVPGISIAVIEDYKLVCAKEYGVRRKDGSEPVTARTLFMAGSISKPVAAVGALSLVEQGKLNLDEDVNLKLRSWKVPENQYTREQTLT